MKTYNIAFTGAFDIANYGDHLFPLIYEKYIENNNYNINLYLFSIFEYPQAFNPDKKVYSLYDIEKIHNDIHFDAIVVGGGELIHFSSCMQLPNNNSKEYVQYNIYDTWVIPSLMGIKYNIKVIWNSPGGQYTFPNIYNNYVKILCNAVDYISVRNYTTKENLIACSVDEDRIKHVPDTGLYISKIYDKAQLSAYDISFFDITKKYIVYHVNRHISEENIVTVIESLKHYENLGYNIVLLPLAYTHNDQDILNKIYEMSNKTFFMPDKMLSLEETITILANCSLYIGISFHGAVTAISYNKPVIIYDYIGSEKSKDLFKLFGIYNQYITDASQLISTINQVINSNTNYNFDEKILQIEEHFKTVFDIITNDNIKKLPITDTFVDNSLFIDTLTKYYFSNNFEMAQRNKEIANAKEYMSTLESELNATKEYIKKLESDYSSAKHYIDTEIAQYEAYKPALNNLSNIHAKYNPSIPLDAFVTTLKPSLKSRLKSFIKKK